MTWRDEKLLKIVKAAVAGDCLDWEAVEDILALDPPPPKAGVTDVEPVSAYHTLLARIRTLEAENRDLKAALSEMPIRGDKPPSGDER